MVCIFWLVVMIHLIIFLIDYEPDPGMFLALDTSIQTSKIKWEQQMNLEISDLSILLVEPSGSQLKMIQKHLKAHGVNKITGVSSGEDALVEMKKFEPDLVISSMYLPDMTAIDLVTTMRDDGTLDHIPFMLISSETRFEHTDPIRQAGVVAILPKPFNHEDLSLALNASLEHIEPDQIVLDNYDVEDLNVLVVDDSATARRHISRILNNLGIENLVTAENGKDAIEKLSEQKFDLVVTDFNMPEMDGQELVEYIRKDLGDTYMPILMVTSEEDEARLASVQKSGVSAIFDKPFDPASIKEILYKMLEEVA